MMPVIKTFDDMDDHTLVQRYFELREEHEEAARAWHAVAWAFRTRNFERPQEIAEALKAYKARRGSAQ